MCLCVVCVYICVCVVCGRTRERSKRVIKEEKDIEEERKVRDFQITTQQSEKAVLEYQSMAGEIEELLGVLRKTSKS